MKVIESQSAVLSNYEVYQHIADQRARYKQKRHRGPPNLENVVKEVGLATSYPTTSQTCSYAYSCSSGFASLPVP